MWYCSFHDCWYLDSTLTKLYIDTCCTQILGWFAGILQWTMQGSTIRTSVQISWQMPGESQHKPSRKWLLSAYRLRTEDIGVLVLRSTVSKPVSVGSSSFTSHFRARVLFSKLTSENRAVTVIAAYFRGHWQRKSYKELKRRHYAAIKIQAFIR